MKRDWILVSFALLSLTSCATVGGNITLGLAPAVLPIMIANAESAAKGPPPNADRAVEAGMNNVMYANAFVAGPAEYLSSDQIDEKKAAQARALTIYLRGRDQVLQGLDLRYPGALVAWDQGTDSEWAEVLGKMVKRDAQGLYWGAAAQMSAYALQPMNVGLSAKLSKTLQMIFRAYELDPDFQQTSLEELLVTIYSSLPVGMGGDPVLAKTHYDLALAKSRGQSTGAFMAWATGVSVPQQNKAEFVEMMNRVLAADPGANPDATLATILNQRKAAWLLGRLDDLFVE